MMNGVRGDELLDNDSSEEEGQGRPITQWGGVPAPQQAQAIGINGFTAGQQQQQQQQLPAPPPQQQQHQQHQQLLQHFQAHQGRMPVHSLVASHLQGVHAGLAMPYGGLQAGFQVQGLLANGGNLQQLQSQLMCMGALNQEWQVQQVANRQVMASLPMPQGV